MPRKNRKQYKSAKLINLTSLTKNVEFLEVPLTQIGCKDTKKIAYTQTFY